MSTGPRTFTLICLGLAALGWAAVPALWVGRGGAGDWPFAMTVISLLLSVPALVGWTCWSDARKDAREAARDAGQRGEGAAGLPSTTDRSASP